GPGGKDWLVTTDALVEGVHFRREWADPAVLGRKALAVNLSDIAAMGGVPRFYLVAIGLPPGDAAGAAPLIYDGMRGMANEHGALLIGGDTVASPSGIMISITAIGEVERGRAIVRSGAHPGDAIFVTGTFGSSGLGLGVLKSGRKGGSAEAFVRRHLYPVPRVAEGRWIAGTGMATAMIDASDGLVADLSHVADESGVGFEIDAPSVPLDDGFDEAARALGHDPVKLALAGGEDYELVFTVADSRIAEFEKVAKGCPMRCRVTRIGTTVADRHARLVIGSEGKALDLPSGGYDHFSQ
ncbi:MAG: thiamine-phosphate kinase, partial [Pseudomonadota bacterium]